MKAAGLICYRNMYRSVRAVVADGVFGEIIEQAVEQRVAAGHAAVAGGLEGNVLPGIAAIADKK